VVYFGLCLPLFQAISKKRQGRKFTIRLGTAWNAKDPEHRWDVFMSFLSFAAALAISMYILDLVAPWLQTQIEIDRCLDAGGRYDAENHSCEGARDD